MARKPVIFVPGFPGSRLHDAIRHRDIFPPSPADILFDRPYLVSRLSGPDDPALEDGVSTNGVVRAVSVLGFEVSEEAETLYDILRGFDYSVGKDFLPVPWDWRLPVYSEDVLGRVRTAIHLLYELYAAPVVVIAHSTGGLVVRSLLESSPPAEAQALAGKIDSVLALGVPWVGTLKTLRYVAGKGKGEAGLSAGQMRAVMGHAWAAYDLMPPDPNRTDMTDDQGRPLNFVVRDGRETSPLIDLGWAGGQAHALRRAAASDLRLGARPREIALAGGGTVDVVNIAGWGEKLDTVCELVGTGAKFRATSEEEGDRTVPFGSAYWLRGPRVRSYAIPVGLYERFTPRYHSQIWDAPPARDVIEHVLTGTPLDDVIGAAVDNDDVLDRKVNVAIRVVAVDRAGRPLQNGEAYFAPGAGQGSKRVPIVNGRATLRYRRGPVPTSGPYRCPVVVAWTAGGQRFQRVLERYFFP